MNDYSQNIETELYELDLNDKQSLDLIDFWVIDCDDDENKLFRAYNLERLVREEKL